MTALEPLDGAPVPWPTVEHLHLWMVKEGFHNAETTDDFDRLKGALAAAAALIAKACGLKFTDSDGAPTLIDPAIWQAILIESAGTYLRKDSAQGFAGFTDNAGIRVLKFDPTVERLIAQWRKIPLRAV